MTAPLASQMDTNVVFETTRPRPDPRIAAFAPDAFIAVTAFTCGFSAMTRNVGEFRDTGIDDVNPRATA